MLLMSYFLIVTNSNFFDCYFNAVRDGLGLMPWSLPSWQVTESRSRRQRTNAQKFQLKLYAAATSGAASGAASTTTATAAETDSPIAVAFASMTRTTPAIEF